MGQENECSADVGVVATSADEQEDDDTLVAQVHTKTARERPRTYYSVFPSPSPSVLVLPPRHLFLFLSPFPRRGTLLHPNSPFTLHLPATRKSRIPVSFFLSFHLLLPNADPLTTRLTRHREPCTASNIDILLLFISLVGNKGIEKETSKNQGDNAMFN